MAVESIVSAGSDNVFFFPHKPFGKFLSPKCTRGNKFKNSNACSCCAMLL